MTKFKTLFALCIVVAIVSTCILSASAALSSSTSVYWGPREDYAWAETVANGPLGVDFYGEAWIRSTSTGNSNTNRRYSLGTTTSVTAETSAVAVTYPSDIPLVTYGGSHGYRN